MMSDGPGVGDPSVPDVEMEAKIAELVKEIEDCKKAENNYINLLGQKLDVILDDPEGIGDAFERAEIIRGALEQNGISDDDRYEFAKLWGRPFMITSENYDFVARMFQVTQKMLGELKAGQYGNREFTDQELGILEQ